MAFPTVQTANTTNGTVTTNSNSWSLTYPGSLAAGDLILGFAGIDGSVATATWPADWVVIRTNNLGAAATVICGAKISTGAESGSFTLGLSASEQGGWRVFRITGWYGSGLGADADGISSAQTATGSPSNTPNPPNCLPANWDVEDTLWIAAIGADTSRTVSAFPTNCPNTQSSDVSGGSGGATLGIAMANSATATFDPDSFTISASDEWGAITVAIRPVSFVQRRMGFVNFQDPGIF